MSTPLVSPTIRFDADGKPVMEGGLSLRDYFAAAALTGLSAHIKLGYYGFADAAGMSYDMADAMLAAREAKP